MINVYIAIGNSDDKLPQRKWRSFCLETNDMVQNFAEKVHFYGGSAFNAAYQTASWVFELKKSQINFVKANLVDLKKKYGQDSIAWSEWEETFFI